MPRAYHRPLVKRAAFRHHVLVGGPGRRNGSSMVAIVTAVLHHYGAVLKKTPTVAQLQEDWGMSRAQAYRWHNAMANAMPGFSMKPRHAQQPSWPRPR